MLGTSMCLPMSFVFMQMSFLYLLWFVMSRCAHGIESLDTTVWWTLVLYTVSVVVFWNKNSLESKEMHLMNYSNIVVGRQACTSISLAEHDSYHHTLYYYRYHNNTVNIVKLS